MLKHLIRKEFLQIRQDRRMLPIVLIAPFVQLLLFGYAANLDVVDIPLVVHDQDRSAVSRELVRKLDGSGFYDPITYTDDMDTIDDLLTTGEAGVALIIPPGVGDAALSGGAAQIQVLVDGTNSTTATQGLNGTTMVATVYSRALLEERLAKAGFTLPGMPQVVPRVWYNPDLKSRNYMVPAILAMILMLMTTMLTSMAIVREKEVGTLEQLIVTPVKPYQMIIGKLLPFVIIGFIQMTAVFLGTVLWFKVPFNGNVGVLYLLALPFLLNTLGLGLLVSTVSSTQQQAMMTTVFFVMMPMMYLSGFAFPIESMPSWVQPVTYLIPLRYFLDIIRGTFLRGVGIEYLWREALCLVVLGSGILTLAVARFKKKLD